MQFVAAELRGAAMTEAGILAASFGAPDASTETSTERGV